MVWPIGITMSILTIAGMCVWTIAIAQSMPVQMDNSYFKDYRDVDMNINEIITKQKEFDTKYSVLLQQKDLKIGENSILVRVVDKQNSAIDDATVDVMMTRPHTVENDIELISSINKDGVYQFEPFDIQDEGRWLIQTRVTINELISHNKLEVNATN